MKQSRKAFTLVELLVVIGIITVLISMLLPVLRKVREQTVKVQCSSNLKQLALMFSIYAAENKGRFPLNDANNSWELGQSFVIPLIGPNIQKPTYLKSPKAFFCPGFDQDTFPSYPASFPNAANRYFFDYAMLIGHCFAPANRSSPVPKQQPTQNVYYDRNGQPIYIDGRVSLGETRDVDLTKLPARPLPILSDILIRHPNPGAPSPNNSWWTVHPYYTEFTQTKLASNQGINIAYSDGHVEWVLASECKMWHTASGVADYISWR